MYTRPNGTKPFDVNQNGIADFRITQVCTVVLLQQINVNIVGVHFGGGGKGEGEGTEGICLPLRKSFLFLYLCYEHCTPPPPPPNVYFWH
jgi:hypothetical protein